MPELPEVETVARGLRPVMESRRIVTVELRRKSLRYPLPRDFAARLVNRGIRSVGRRAKYVLVNLDNGEALLIHLGMTGRLTVLPASGGQRNLGEFYNEEAATANPAGKHDHVVFGLDDGTRIVFTDPRRFGAMDIVPEGGEESHPRLKDLGPEPFGNGFSSAHLAGRFRGKKAPLKAALLDQGVVAGLGNIYVCEALFRSGLSPKRRAGSLARTASVEPRLDTLVRHIRDILEEAIIAGGSTLQDFAGADGSSGAYQQRFLVYDREGEPCTKCRKPIKRIVQSGRSTFYCPACQK